MIVVPIDDYCMVLGIDFLDKVRPWSFERDNTMHISKISTIHIIPLERTKTRARNLSTMKLDKGFERDGSKHISYDHSNKIKKNMKPKKEVQINETHSNEHVSLSHLKIDPRVYEVERGPTTQGSLRKQSTPYLKKHCGEKRP